MIELEIQALAEQREGLLMDVGRLIIASGFTLQRQRLIADRNGILLTLVVRGPWLKRRALEAALNEHRRLISVRVATFKEGAEEPHFAASRAPIAYTPPPRPPEAEAARGVDTAGNPEEAHAPVPPNSAVDIIGTPTENRIETGTNTTPAPADDFEFILPTPRTRPPDPDPTPTRPYVEVVPLEADLPAVEAALQSLEYDYPRIFPRLLKMDQSVAEGARASSLTLAGQRTGTWVHQRDYASTDRLELAEAIEQIATPALQALVETEQKSAQMHIRQSPLCPEGGHSGCAFFGGFLEGLLQAATGVETVTTVSVCCRSYGADECVLAISD